MDDEPRYILPPVAKRVAGILKTEYADRAKDVRVRVLRKADAYVSFFDAQTKQRVRLTSMYQYTEWLRTNFQETDDDGDERAGHGVPAALQ